MSFSARKLVRVREGHYPITEDAEGYVVLAKPLSPPLKIRLLNAWRVVTGQVDIIFWPSEGE